MTRESVTVKARRYLIEQRLTVTRVDGDVADALVRGDTGEYHVGHDPVRGWRCTCLARRPCAHITAFRMVTTRPREGGEAA